MTIVESTPTPSIDQPVCADEHQKHLARFELFADGRSPVASWFDVVNVAEREILPEAHIQMIVEPVCPLGAIRAAVGDEELAHRTSPFELAGLSRSGRSGDSSTGDPLQSETEIGPVRPECRPRVWAGVWRDTPVAGRVRPRDTAPAAGAPRGERRARAVGPRYRLTRGE